MKRHFHLLRLLRTVRIALCVLFPALLSAADDKPRVTITVAKRSVGRPASKAVGGVETGRPQSLFVALENQSLRTVPEGTIRWSAVVRKYSGGMLKYTGTEPVKSLRASQGAEIACGLFEIDTRPGNMSLERDRIDYEVVYLAEEKELARISSVGNFAALAQKAQPMVADAEPVPAKPEEPAVPKKAADEKRVLPPIIGAEKMPSTMPTMPAAEITKPADAPPPSSQPFDFFNLRGKKLPVAK
jgi:hypothetical protein